MAIIKTKIREKNYVQIEKTGIEDNRLSWAATGLLTYLIGRPADWVIVMEHLKTVKTDGRDSTRTALNNLREFNYCHYFEMREQGKVRETVYLVFESPTSPEEAMRHIEAEEGMELHYKKYSKDKKESQKIETIENTDVSPKTGKPFPAQPFSGNPTLLIIDVNKDRITNNRTTTTNEKSESSKSSSRYDFLDSEKFSKLNGVTKKNVRNNISDLTQEKAEETYKLTEEFIQKRNGKSFDAIFYSGIQGQWNFKLENIEASKEKLAVELDEQKIKWLNQFSGLRSNKALYEEVKEIIRYISIDTLIANRSKLSRLQMFEFKQQLWLLKKSA